MLFSIFVFNFTLIQTLIMKNFNNNSLLVFVFLALTSIFSLSAQDVTTIEATNSDISDNLDLEAVASIFGDAKDLEDFEKKLNDPNIQISNLDLNEDGEVDFLRVMETSQNNVHSISIQAVLGKDQYQEVAVIDVEKDSKGTQKVQVVGNVDMYGPNYYITPTYTVVPVFFSFFWMTSYRPFYSPWYWGYHPPYFNPWRPYSPYRYRNNVHVYVNINNYYHITNVRMNNNVNLNRKRNNNNYYFNNNPNKSFTKRNPGVQNREALNNSRKSTAKSNGINNKESVNRVANDKGYRSTGRPVSKDNLKKTTTRPSNNKVTKPTTRPTTTKPSARPTTTKPSARPTTTKPTKKTSSTRTATKQSTQPASKSSSSSNRSKPSSSSYSRQSPSKASPTRTRH